MKGFLCGLLMMLASPAFAVQPESGWWWNESQPGRGFSIEVQNNVMFFAGYLYNANGTATWYVAQGTYSHSLSRFDGPLLAFGGGQCLTCAYQPAAQGTSPGALTLSFSSQNTGTLSWPGGTVPITRTIYGTTNNVKRILGAWVFTANVANILQDGDWLNMTTEVNTSNGLAIGGTNLGSRTTVALVSGSDLGILIDSSTSYYDMYIFPMQGTGVESLGNGREWLYLKTGSPTGLGNPALAFKRGPAPVGTAQAPDANKMTEMSVDLAIAMRAIKR